MRLACGRCYRVNDRVDRIIEDGTGKMRHLQNTVSLEGSLCSCPHINPGGCTRADIVYWRGGSLPAATLPASRGGRAAPAAPSSGALVVARPRPPPFPRPLPPPGPPPN